MYTMIIVRAFLFLTLLFGLPVLAQENSESKPVEAVPATEEAPVSEAVPTSEVAPVAVPVTEQAGAALVGDGKRLEIPERGLSIVTPRGWEVYTNQPSLTLLMQMPYEKGMKYQRTIQIATFVGERFIDEATAKEYSEVIVRKFSEAAVNITDYRIRNHMKIEMADGRPALLFYSEFAIDEVPLMQAHIIVSSADRHYLITYTDLAEHFEGEQSGQFLTEAWETMTSVQVEGDSPGRYDTLILMSAILGSIVLLFALLMLLRSWYAGRRYMNYANDGGEFDDEPLTQEEKFISGKKSEAAPASRPSHPSTAHSVVPKSEPKKSVQAAKSEQASTVMSKMPSETPKKSGKGWFGFGKKSSKDSFNDEESAESASQMSKFDYKTEQSKLDAGSKFSEFTKFPEGDDQKKSKKS